MSTDINEVRERLEHDAEGFFETGIAVPTVADLRALLADHAKLQAISGELMKALTRLTEFVATDVAESCNGGKCRQPWCAGCCGDEAAEQAMSEARNALVRARAVITEAKAMQMQRDSGEVQSDPT